MCPLTQKDWEEFEKELDKAAEADEKMTDDVWQAILDSIPEIDSDLGSEDAVIAFGLRKRKGESTCRSRSGDGSSRKGIS